jgi:anti-sigma B factor antagonist
MIEGVKMSNLVITERQQETVIILDLVGQIRLGGGNVTLRQHLNQLIQAGKTNILLNLAEVSHIDSSGLGELVAGYVSLQKLDGELKLLNLNSRIREIMGIVKLLTIFNTFDSEEEAIDSFELVAEKRELKQSAIETDELNKNSGYASTK